MRRGLALIAVAGLALAGCVPEETAALSGDVEALREELAEVRDRLNDAERALEKRERRRQGMEQDIQSSDVMFEFELKGTLLWDLEAGRVHSLELSGDTESVIDSAATISMMGEELEIEQATYVSGSLEVKVDVTTE